VRRAAIKTLQGEADEAACPLIEKAWRRKPAGLKAQLGLVRAPALLGSTDPAKRRLGAAQHLLPPAATRPRKHRAARSAAQSENRPNVKAALEASRTVEAAGLGRPAGRAVQRHQPGLHPAAGGAGPGHHLRADGRDQHGPRRADDDRRLRHLRGAGLFQRYLPGAFDWYLVAAVPVAFMASA
jgi:urea transport system permease protein